MTKAKKTIKRKTPKKYKKNNTTIRQTETNKKILENNGNVSKAMREAGYSDNYSKNPQAFKATKAGQDLIKMCNDLRDKSLKHAAQKLADATYAEGVRGAETLNKISRLETGESDGEREIVIRIETFKS